MKVVIDTNLFWVSISRKSSTHWIFEELLNGKFELCISSEILSEYEEITANRLGLPAASAAMELLDTLSNVIKVDVYYRWNLITADPDDNKFTDCAIAGACNYIVTQDHHF